MQIISTAMDVAWLAHFIGECLLLTDTEVREDLAQQIVTGKFTSDLRQSILVGTVLAAANLAMSRLGGADLSQANLKNADLRGADLTGAYLTETALHGAKLGWTMLGDLDLKHAEGLEEVCHSGPSSLGLDTLTHSVKHLPDAFLRGTGVPTKIAESVARLHKATIFSETCLLRSVTEDAQFVKRIRQNLHARGIRCWEALEDWSVGERVRARVRPSVRAGDVLLLVISRHSLAADWLGAEVESTLERERREGRTILYPILLDFPILSRETGWPARIRDNQHL